MKILSWKESKIGFLKRHYEKYLEEFAGCTDDRQIYCNTYKMIMRAVESLPDEPDDYILVAVNHAIKKDLQMMNNIIICFRHQAKEVEG